MYGRWVVPLNERGGSVLLGSSCGSSFASRPSLCDMAASRAPFHASQLSSSLPWWAYAQGKRPPAFRGLSTDRRRTRSISLRVGHGRLPGRFLEVFPRCAQVFPAWSDYEDSGTVVRRGPTVSILLCDVVICAAFGVWWRGRAAAFRRGRGLRSSGGRVVGYNGSTARAPPALWHPIPALQPLTPFNLSTYDASSTGPPNGLAQNSGAQSPFFLRADASTELVDATLLYPRACPDSAATLAVRMLPLSLGEVG